LVSACGDGLFSTNFGSSPSVLDLPYKIPFEFSMTPVINRKSSVLLMGSCFSEHIGRRLERALVNMDLNPFGVLYSPVVIAEDLQRLIKNELITEGELILNGNLYHSWFHHGRFSGRNKAEVLGAMNDRIEKANTLLAEEDVTVLITFGSAHAFRRGDQLVANCHKYPASEFEQVLLPLEEMVEQWKETLDQLFSFNGNLKVVFTVSPVRYLKDGIIANNRSKSRLIELCHILSEYSESAQYFPAFEIVNDELRDYRFFEKDMTHPNEIAVDYVWRRFIETCFDEGRKEIHKAWEPLERAALHRSLHPGTEADLAFKESTLQKLNAFALTHSMEQNKYLEELKRNLNDG